MKFPPLPIVALLALAACGSAPGDAVPDKILVVPATAARGAAMIAARPASLAPPAPAGHAPALSVEESARINTSEMWSEPIAAEDAEPIVIE